VLVAVAAAAMLIGAAIATSVILLFDGDGGPPHRYNVSVFLDHDITDEQQDVVQSALTALDPVDGIRFESREEAWQQFQEMFSDQPDLIASIRPESLPESFRLTTTGESFDCPPLTSVQQLAGVAEIVVVQLPTDGRLGAPVSCP
jgi:cell division protein FtsX